MPSRRNPPGTTGVTQHPPQINQLVCFFTLPLAVAKTEGLWWLCMVLSLWGRGMGWANLGLPARKADAPQPQLSQPVAAGHPPGLGAEAEPPPWVTASASPPSRVLPLLTCSRLSPRRRAHGEAGRHGRPALRQSPVQPSERRRARHCAPAHQVRPAHVSRGRAAVPALDAPFTPTPPGTETPLGEGGPRGPWKAKLGGLGMGGADSSGWGIASFKQGWAPSARRREARCPQP